LRVARFRVHGGKSYVVEGASVIVDRALQLVTVRPFRARKSYTLPLWALADFVVYRCVKAELAEKAREKKARRRRIL
jgi:hypothetical protein